MLALLIVFKKPVWLALLATSLTMGLLGIGLNSLVNLVLSTASSATAIDLIVVVFLIGVLVNLYNVTGFIRKLGNELVKFLGKPRLVASLVPAVMGLLPVPGGALMSAPVVEAVGKHLGLRSEKMVFVNVWFRHVVFIVYPLSATIITVASLASVNLWSLVARGLPVALSMVVTGYAIGFRGTHTPTTSGRSLASKTELVKALLPMLAAVTIAVTTSPFLDEMLVPWIPVTRYSMVLGLAISIALLFKLSGTTFENLAKAVASKTTVELILASFAAVLLRDVFVAVGGPELISRATPLTSGVESVVLMVVIPFAISLATGLPIAGAVIALSVFKSTANLGIREVALIYSSNMLGYIASPAHLCYVYTAQYFKVPLTSTYKEVFVATTIAILVAVIFNTLI